MANTCNFYTFYVCPNSRCIYLQCIDSPKKQTNEFDLFAVKSKKANKANSSVLILGEFMASQSAFEIN